MERRKPCIIMMVWRGWVGFRTEEAGLNSRFKLYPWSAIMSENTCVYVCTTLNDLSLMTLLGSEHLYIYINIRTKKDEKRCSVTA